MEATITSKGQITLPKSFRDKYSLKAGEKLVFIEDADGSTRIIARRNDIEAIIGRLKPRKNILRSIEDLSKATEQGAALSYTDTLK